MMSMQNVTDSKYNLKVFFQGETWNELVEKTSIATKEKPFPRANLKTAS